MRIFVSYSRKDKRICEQLLTHLRALLDDSRFELFVDTGIELSRRWRGEIDEALATADVALLLVSAPFLASQFVKTIELPAIRDAAERRGTRIIPLYVGPADLSAFDFAAHQGANMPDRPLSLMRSPARDLVFADLVTKLRRFAADAQGTEPDVPALTETIPSSGRLFDRVEDRAALARFLKQPTRRVCILRGFPGVGKTVLVARVAEQKGGAFRRICWIRSQERGTTAEEIFGQLDAFLEAGGDRSLRAPRQIRDEAKRHERLLEATIEALSRHPYLVVFDDFGSRDGPAQESGKAAVAALLAAFASRGRATKMILISDRHAADYGKGTPAPVGTLIERELHGLPPSAVRELMAECGLPDADDASVQRITQALSGNPTAIAMLCSLASRLQVDPLQMLSPSGDGDGAFRQLLERSMEGLGDEARSVLARMSLLRRPVGWDALASFGLARGPVLVLLDRLLLSIEPASRSLVLPELVRRFVRRDIADAPAEHVRLAAGYDALVAARGRTDLEQAKLRLEAGHHHLAAGDAATGAAQMLAAIGSLVGWGYTTLAEDAIARVLAADPASAAWALYERGRIADRRGRFPEALDAFHAALGEGPDDNLRARCLFFVGRIKSAQGAFDAAQVDLDESIALSRRPGVDAPSAAAILALAWVAKERGAKRADALAAFEQALVEAIRQEDWISASDAHRQVGFLGWLCHRRRDVARHHYAQALRFARQCRALPQIAATFNELGYLATDWDQSDRAVGYCTRAIAIAQDLADGLLLAAATTNLALAQWKRGELASARAGFARAGDLSRRSGNPGGEVYARYELGRLLAQNDDPVAARVQWEIARDICQQKGLAAQLPGIEAALAALDADARAASPR